MPTAEYVQLPMSFLFEPTKRDASFLPDRKPHRFYNGNGIPSYTLAFLKEAYDCGVDAILTDKERQAIGAYYFYPTTLNQVGEVIGLKGNAAKGLICRALIRLYRNCPQAIQERFEKDEILILKRSPVTLPRKR